MPGHFFKGGTPMSLLIADAHAQAAGGAAPAGGGLSQILVLVVFVVVFYFLLIRPQQKRAKEHQALLSKLTAGDEVLTAGGILGRIAEVSDTFITLEVADGVRIKVQKAQVTSLVPKGTYKSA
jgi:preprotein translocase subunit YajC